MLNCFAFLLVLSMVQSTKLEDKQPNIIYILSDDLGHGDVGFTGGNIKTPNLDRLAKEGKASEAVVYLFNAPDFHLKQRILLGYCILIESQ